MSATNERTVNDELRFLLHPADRRDIPVPGFPPHDALMYTCAPRLAAGSITRFADENG